MLSIIITKEYPCDISSMLWKCKCIFFLEVFRELTQFTTISWGSVYKYYEVIINLGMHSNENLGKTLRVVKDRGVLRPNWFYWVLKKSDQQNVRANSAVALLNCFNDSQRPFIWESKPPNHFTVWYSTTWVNQAADIYLLSPFFTSKKGWNLNQIAKLTITRTWVVNITEFLRGRFKRYITLAVFHVH